MCVSICMQVKHNYDTNDLSEKHSNPLASCVRDCETSELSLSVCRVFHYLVYYQSSFVPLI